MHSLLACSAYFPKQSTFGQKSGTNLNGTKKERKTHTGQLNGQKRNEERRKLEGEKERVLVQCTWGA
jgi:hypothetical protein